MNTATDRLLRAQACMEDIVRDTARIEEFTEWLGESARRVSTFSDYYQGKWAVDRDVEDTPVLDVAGVTRYSAALCCARTAASVRPQRAATSARSSPS